MALALLHRWLGQVGWPHMLRCVTKTPQVANSQIRGRAWHCGEFGGGRFSDSRLYLGSLHDKMVGMANMGIGFWHHELPFGAPLVVLCCPKPVKILKDEPLSNLEVDDRRFPKRKVGFQHPPVSFHDCWKGGLSLPCPWLASARHLVTECPCEIT